MEKFNKLVITEDENGNFHHEIKSVNFDSLPQNEVLVKVYYSSLNFKDALSATGNKGVTKKYPHTPGIDAAGVVENGGHSEFKKGDEVIVTSYDLGMNTSGGFSEYISVPASWVVKKPETLSLIESMIFGTAGLTAAMCIDKIMKNGLKTGSLAVTGASGGVGTMAIMLLKKLGFAPIAISRKTAANDFLKKIGASEILNEFIPQDRPLLKPIFDGAIDTVGGSILETILKSIKPNGSVSICGMALSPNFQTTVFPFILRGLSMFGIDSAEAEMPWREELWQKLASEWKPENLESIAKTVKLIDIWPEIEKILKGEQTGRVVIEMT